MRDTIIINRGSHGPKTGPTPRLEKSRLQQLHPDNKCLMGTDRQFAHRQHPAPIQTRSL